MAIDFVCPTCNGTLRVGDASAGRVIRCGACMTMLRVPGLASGPPPRPPSPPALSPLAAVPVAPPRARENPPASTPPNQSQDTESPVIAEIISADEPPLVVAESELPLASDVPVDGAQRAEAALAAAWGVPTNEPRAAEPAPTDAVLVADPRATEPTRRSNERERNNSYDRPRNRDLDRDDDDRPRRRRRRRGPPPPAGRGALFWLVLVGGLFVLLTFGCCGGLYFAIPGPKWQKHESVKGGFKVDLPAAARPDMEQMTGMRPDPNVKVEGTILFGRMEEYAVAYSDIPLGERQFGTDKQRLDQAVNTMKASGEVQSVLRQKDITVCGFPAREVEFSDKDDGWFIARIIIADGRRYVLVAGGPFATLGNENARRFLDSFEVTDPKLKIVGQKREEDARRGVK